ncbi:MAG: hypothetical protein CMO55_06445 [Verrucomicrobiales bacterium]|nr:hypothetical protein [Verrucomicrobiales bacterium]
MVPYFAPNVPNTSQTATRHVSKRPYKYFRLFLQSLKTLSITHFAINFGKSEMMPPVFRRLDILSML